MLNPIGLDTPMGMKPISGSVEALHEIARHYDLIYFTARPRFTLQKTPDWLATHG